MNNKIILLGDSGVGKTSLINYLVDEVYSPTTPTIGASYVTKNYYFNGRAIRLSIWDTGGQERYRSLIRMYYRDVAAAVCFIDVTNPKTLISVQTWINDYKINSTGLGLFYLVANKTDMPMAAWQVSMDEIKKLADEHEVKYFFTSALVGDSCKKAFEEIAKELSMMVEVKPKENELDYIQLDPNWSWSNELKNRCSC